MLAEVEALIADLERMTGTGRVLLLEVRVNLVVVLVEQERYTEAEAEADGILRAATRLAHLTKVWEIELTTLANLAAALCGQGRYEEAEAIARGNLPRADADTAAVLQRVLVRSLNGRALRWGRCSWPPPPLPSAAVCPTARRRSGRVW
ncbi:tetratricopeptide repeat protein [Streptomyces sp. NPDC056661]|uniref:tetratricopeptide repeat protein n=1 Tax=Streptomyces sp. NPDC056661 TaxID=3345898 RepID=UPI00368C41FF